MPKNTDDHRDAVTSDSLQAYLRRIATILLLSREEEGELARRAQAGDQEALDQLIVSNLRYVVSVARRYLGYGLGLADLINEGNIGLIQAIQRFDPARGVKLITYAVWWIRLAITHAMKVMAAPPLRWRVRQGRASVIEVACLCGKCTASIPGIGRGGGRNCPARPGPLTWG